ncbi:hypothetical protein [Streptomyces sp. R41]|uniref:Uncharacterized protein n=1 Tax=Streptomyces sp. R41 TaxID=3238632 RepID=A0AB39R4N6_9ACTN
MVSFMKREFGTQLIEGYFGHTAGRVAVRRVRGVDDNPTYRGWLEKAFDELGTGQAEGRAEANEELVQLTAAESALVGRLATGSAR